MNNKEVILYIKKKTKGIKTKIRAGILKKLNCYMVYVMASYIDKSSIGSFNFLEIAFNTEKGANTLKDLINKTFKEVV